MIRLFLVGLIFSFRLIFPVDILANGNVTEFVTKTAGPYEVSLGTMPPDPGVGNIHLSVKVSDIESGEVVPGANVLISAIGPGSDSYEIGPLEATNDFKSPMFYDLDTRVDREGEWLFTVDVSGKNGEGTTDFQVVIKNQSPIPGLLTLSILIALLVILGLSFRGYLLQRNETST